MDSDKDFFEINILSLANKILAHRTKIKLFTLIGLIFSILYSMSLDKIYVTDSIHVRASPNGVSTENQASGLNSLLGSIAGGSGGSSEISKIILHLKSRTFFQALYQDDLFLAELMAFQSYDASTNAVLFDESSFDPKSGAWVSSKPLFENAYEAFHGDHFNVFSDMISGYITVRVKYYSPEIAVKWNNQIVNSINEFTRDEYINKSLGAIEFYKSQLVLANSGIVRNTLIRGIEREMATLALSEITDEFSLEIIDRAFTPSRASEPQRKIIVLMGTIISMFIAVVLAIIFELYTYQRNNKSSL